jgi:hypothetical protein
MSVLRGVLFVAILALGGYLYSDQVRTFALQAYREVAPCTVPISYRIGSIDPRFGLSTSTLVATLEEAADAWESAAGKKLFTYDQDRGGLEINLVYDVRQETTGLLRELGLSVEQDLGAYESIKARYEQLLDAYEADKRAFESRYSAFERDARAYARDVSMWNERGGAPRGTYEMLRERKAALDREEAQLRTLLSGLNTRAESVNTLAERLNAIARELNMSVAAYNTVGDVLPGEFEQAVYQSRPGAHRIDVFEYDSKERLTRVLMHELGHALGLEHIEDEDAVMYRLNQSRSERLGEGDREALQARCRL